MDLSISHPSLGLGLMALVGTLFLLGMLALASFLGPKFKTPTKQIPFECGAVPVGNVSDQRFNVRYYLIAMLFILFDIEVIFMYPWARILVSPEGGLGWQGFWQMVGFIAVLAIGLIYVWRKGVLDWNK